MPHQIKVQESRFAQFVFGDTRLSWLWLIVRLYVGYEWVTAGWDKFNNPAWLGPQVGAAVKGFLTGALGKMSGAHPDVQSWYGYFIQNFAMQHAVIFSYLVTFGELAVGIALILGFLTGISASFGAFLNFQFLLSGTVSVNPQLILLEFLLILAWRTAGWYGLDRIVLKKFYRSS